MRLTRLRKHESKHTMQNPTHVFLGGTCGNNQWRLGFIAAAVAAGMPSETLFNPVVADWNEEAQQKEDSAKAAALVNLFYIADPLDGTGLSAYSLVEATMALYDRPETTVVVLDSSGMTGHALKVMTKTAKDLRRRFDTIGRKARIFDTSADALRSIVASYAGQHATA